MRKRADSYTDVKLSSVTFERNRLDEEETYFDKRTKPVRLFLDGWLGFYQLAYHIYVKNTTQFILNDVKNWPQFEICGHKASQIARVYLPIQVSWLLLSCKVYVLFKTHS